MCKSIFHEKWLYNEKQHQRKPLLRKETVKQESQKNFKKHNQRKIKILKRQNNMLEEILLHN